MRKLGVISAAGVAMVQQIHQQAEHAEYLGAEGALMFARVARAVRQSVAMGRGLGAHDAACSDGQLGQLDMVSEIGAALIERLRLQIRGCDWFNGLDALMMARLAVATERTILLEQRINAERALTPDERDAAQKAHAVAARRKRPRRAGVPNGAAVPQAAAPAVLTIMVSGLAQALGENEGDPRAARGAGRRGLRRGVAAGGFRASLGRGGDRRTVAGGDCRGSVPADRRGAGARLVRGRGAG